MVVTSKARDVWEVYADKLNSAMCEIRAPLHNDHSQHLKMLKGDIWSNWGQKQCGGESQILRLWW